MTTRLMTSRLWITFLSFTLISFVASAAPITSTGSGNWEDAGSWDAGVPGVGDDVTISAGHTITINGLAVKQINSLTVNGTLDHADSSTAEDNKVILDITANCLIASGGNIDVSDKGYNNGQGPGYPGASNGSGSHGGRGRGNHATAYGDTYGSIIAPTNYGSGGGSTEGGGAVIMTVGGETHLAGNIKANSGSGGSWQYPGAGGSVYLTTATLVGIGNIEARSVGSHFTGGGGRIAVVLTGSDSFGSITNITYASQNVSADGMCGTVYLEKQSDTAGQGELFIDQNDIAVGGKDYLYTTMSDTESVSYQFARVTTMNGGVITIGADDTMNVTGATLAGDPDDHNDGILVDGGTLIGGATLTIGGLGVAVRSGSTFDVATTLTIATNGGLRIDAPHTISGDVIVENGGIISHSANDTTEDYKIDLSIGGDLQIDAGGAVNVDLKGYSTHDGPGYTSYCGSYGGEGYNGAGDTYGSIVSPTNIGSGGQSSSGGGAAILTVTGETRLYGDMTASAPYAGSWKYPGSGGSIFLTTSNLVGTGTMKASSGLPSGHFSGGGGRIAVHLTGPGSSFGSVTMTAAPENSSYDSAAGTVYKRTASQGLNEGTLIIDNSINASHSTLISANVTGTSVGDVIIQNSGELTLAANQTLKVSRNWSNDNTFVANAGSRVEFVGTDTATVYGSTTFKELVCTNVEKQINFEDGATTGVDEIFRFAGPLSKGLLLRSTSAGTQWLLDVDAGATEVTANYLNVKDSNANAGQAITASSAIDSGNNDNWVFAVVGQTNTWIGVTNSDWSENSNWDLGRPPASIDAGTVISNNCANYPSLPSVTTLANFNMLDPSYLSLAGNNLTIEGDAAIAGILAATGTETLTLEGDVDFTSGTFTQAQTTVLLAGTGAQSITSAGEICYRLTVTNSGRTVTFSDLVSATYFRNESVNLTLSGGVTAGEMRSYSWDGAITHTFGASSTSTIDDMFLVGESGQVITLVSSTPTTQWVLDVDRIAYAKYVNVTDSDASAGMTIYPINSADGGNNNNWNFSATWLTWDGSSSADFATAANWTPSGTPDGTKRLNIDGNGGNAPVASAAAAALEILLGAENTSTLTFNDTLTVGENVRVMGFGTLTADEPSTIGGDLTVLDGGVLTHTANSTTEANKLDLTVGGNLYIGSSAEVNVNDKGYNSKQGPGYGASNSGGSHGGIGKGNGTTGGPTYGSIVAPTNCGSGGGSWAGGGVAILDVTQETTLYGSISANASLGGSWKYPGAGGSVFLTTSNLVGTGTIEANSGIDHFSGGGGRVAVHLTGPGSGFGSVTITAYGDGSSNDGSAGTVYKRTATEGVNEGTLIIDQAQNSTLYTEIQSLVADKSVGDVIIRNNGELLVDGGETLQVSGSWSNGNVFVANAGGRVEFVGTDTVTVYGNTTFKELVATNLSKQINFEAGSTTDVDEDLLLSGSGGPNLVLRSTSDGTQWLLDVDAGTAQTVENVDVKDSNADPGATISPTGSTDGGNNSNWTFAVVGVTNTWLGGVSTDWSTAGNWDQGRPPIAGDVEVIISNGSFDPALPSAQSVNDLTVDAGAFLNLATFDFTVNGTADINGGIIAQTTETLTFNGDADFNGGSFNRATSTVYLADTDAQSLTSAGISFYTLIPSNSGRTVTCTDVVTAEMLRNESVNLTLSGGTTSTTMRVYSGEGAIALTFGAGSASQIQDMFLMGESGKVITLVSSTPTTQWDLDVDRIAYAKYVNVTDSDASAGETIYPYSSTDGGNNLNWDFGATVLVWDGSTDADFDDASNWTPATAPDGSARCVIDGNYANAPVVSVAQAVLELSIGCDQTSVLTVDAELNVGEDLNILGFGTLVASKPSTISNDLTVLDGAAITHSDNAGTEAYKINLTVGGDFYFATTAEIDLDGKGYGSGGPGYGPYAFGASHGGQGGAGTGPAKDTYGSVLAPTNIGSASHSVDGGGAVQLTVSGETRLYGYVHANGESAGGYASGAAGGSIFLTTGTLVGNGTLSAEGGTSSSYAAGGGGRISVVLTSGTSFDQVDINVRGATGGSQYHGANGTIYTQTGSEADGAGTVLVDCDGRSPDSTSYDSATTVLPDTGYVTDELTDALLVVSNANTHMRVMADLYVGDLLVYDSTTITLGIYTMYVDSAEHHLDDRAQPNAGGPTNNVDDYSHIVWIGAYPGTVIMFQ